MAPDAHDVIDLGGLGVTFADLTLTVQAGSTTVSFVGHAGDQIVLTGVTGLTAADFQFQGPGSRNFIGNTLGNTADAGAGVLTGFIGGTLADLQDGFGDRFFGNGGADSILAGVGDDSIEGRAGADTLTGGGGINTASFAGLALRVAVDLSAA